jgi:hypothetical protein
MNTDSWVVSEMCVEGFELRPGQHGLRAGIVLQEAGSPNLRQFALVL